MLEGSWPPRQGVGSGRRWPRSRGERGWLPGALLVLAAHGAAAQEPRTVTRLSFRGNRALDRYTIAAAIATSASTWTYRVPLLKRLPLGERREFDEAEFRRDVVRLQLLYRQHGFYEARVDTTVRRAPREVRVTFRIVEGEPVRVVQLSVRGAERIVDPRWLAERIPLRPLAPFGRAAFEAGADSIVAALTARGYPFAEVFRDYAVDLTTRQATVAYDVAPGPRARIGRISVVGARSVGERTIRRALAFRTSDWFDREALFTSQRALYRTDLFDYVNVGVAPDSTLPGTDTLVAIRVQVGEGRPRAARAGIGYGTVDCFRTQGSLTWANFLGGARRFEIGASAAKLGVGKPADAGFQDALCPALRGDRFSDRVTYQASLDLTQPAFLGRRNALGLSLLAERRSELQAFEREAIGAAVALTTLLRRDVPVALAYRYSYGSTRADDAVFCTLFDRCESATVRLLSERRRQATITLTGTRTRTDAPVDPSRGSVVSLEAAHASPWIGSDTLISFNKAAADATFYRQLWPGWVAALELFGGAIFSARALVGGRGVRFVPPEERFYAGGPASVRGYARNQLGPVVYVTDSLDAGLLPADTVPVGVRSSPVGGNALALAKLELRFPSAIWPSRLRMAAFVDVGELWEQAGDRLVSTGRRISPGLGVRFATPLGPVRADLAYNGYDAQVGSLYLVQPGTGEGAGSLVQVRRTYRPDGPKSFLRRLRLQLSVGQAF